MTGKVAFFKLDGEREKLVWEIAENLESMPKCADAREALEVIHRELESLELSLAQKIVREFTSSQEGLLRLTRELAEAFYAARLESPGKNLLELCERLNECALNVECLQSSELRVRLLRSFETLLGIISLFCSDFLGVAIEACRKLGDYPEYKTLVRDVTFHRKLKNAKEAVEKVKNHLEDYAILRRLAAAYSFYRSRVTTRCSTESPIEVFNIVASESRASSILRYLREKANMDEVDLVEAFKHVRVLEEMLKERFNIDEELEVLAESPSSEKQLYGTVPALAYVLAHASGFVNLEELLGELSNYVEAALANINRMSKISAWEERLRELFYSLVKILALVLCMSGHVDWRLATTFALSAAKYWPRWAEESSFIALCDAVRAVLNFVTREEAVRILTYAALYGDYDFIVKLKPFLWAYGSLDSINPLR